MRRLSCFGHPRVAPTERAFLHRRVTRAQVPRTRSLPVVQTGQGDWLSGSQAADWGSSDHCNLLDTRASAAVASWVMFALDAPLANLPSNL